MVASANLARRGSDAFESVELVLTDRVLVIVTFLSSGCGGVVAGVRLEPLVISRGDTGWNAVGDIGDIFFHCAGLQAGLWQ